MASKTMHVELNALDHLPPPNYSNAILYLPLKADVTAETAFSFLQNGLQRTFVQLPWLDGKVYPISPRSPDTPRLLEIRHGEVLGNDCLPQQVKFNELKSSETYEDLRESAFHPASYEDEALTWAPFLPDVTNGAEVLVAQANFLPGACILTAAVSHASSDGMGVFSVLKIWADNCRDLELEVLPEKVQPPEISNRSLLERICTSEGTGRSVEQIPPETWRLLGLEPPRSAEPKARAETNGLSQSGPPPPLVPSTSARCLQPYIFYISPSKVAALRDECKKETGAADVSVNDVICALVWRGLIKARIAARGGESERLVNGERAAYVPNMEARLDLPFDARPYFSQALPLNYLGNFTMINQALLPLSKLVAPSTSIGSVAGTIRQVAAEVTPASLMDAYTLVKTIQEGLKLENLRVDGNGLMITSLLAFPMTEVCFGETVFGNGGKPEALRTLMGAINKVFRYCVILPKKSHGGVEFIANLFEEEMDFLMEDKEFGRYAVFVA